jgi:hypothetical protein
MFRDERIADPDQASRDNYTIADDGIVPFAFVNVYDFLGVDAKACGSNCELKTKVAAMVQALE